MKNIHLLPTDKPSRLIKSQDNDFIFLNTDAPNWFEINFKTTKQNIYITSDEEIKDVRPHKGKWQLEKGEILNKFPDYLTDLSECKLVIMTTDQDLIQDGVQAIPDEFLEWFVKNPSCEEVEVNKLCYGALSGFADAGYKIIIPKEETLEEAKKYAELSYYGDEVDAFVRGVKWQQEQDKKLYSEEYMLNFAWFLKENLGQYSCDRTAHFEGKYLEQFKKK